MISCKLWQGNQIKVAETAANKWNVDEFGNDWRKFQKRYVKKMRGMANRVECIARGHAVHSVKIDSCVQGGLGCV